MSLRHWIWESRIGYEGGTEQSECAAVLKKTKTNKSTLFSVIEPAYRVSWLNIN